MLDLCTSVFVLCSVYLLSVRLHNYHSHRFVASIAQGRGRLNYHREKLTSSTVLEYCENHLYYLLCRFDKDAVYCVLCTTFLSPARIWYSHISERQTLYSRITSAAAKLFMLILSWRPCPGPDVRVWLWQQHSYIYHNSHHLLTLPLSGGQMPHAAGR